jgi:hypothetical protein
VDENIAAAPIDLTAAEITVHAARYLERLTGR